MKICYFGNFRSELPTIDQDILYSLKKQAKVVVIDLREMNSEQDAIKIINKANECDAFLFHALVPEVNELFFQLMVERIGFILDGITCKKVLWFFDKIVGAKMRLITGLLPKVDLMFVADDTWLRRFNDPIIFPLHPAAPEKPYHGKFKEELSCDIAMAGTFYGERNQQYDFLKRRFGESFKFYDDKFGQDYADLCKSAKIIVTPMVPFDDFYWSDRIYTTLANGGLCVHSRAHGLQEEGFVDGKHYFDYYTEQDLYVTLKMLLDKKSDKLRKGVAKCGEEFVMGGCTYADRVEEILEKINEINK